MENNMFIKPIYKCGVCGIEHESIVARANCELACTKRVEEEAKKAAEAKKKAEQKARMAEVDAAFEAADKLMKAYIEDYGSYTYAVTMDIEDVKDGLDALDFLSFLLG